MANKCDGLLNFLIWIPLLLCFLPGAFVVWLYQKLWAWLVTNFLKPNYRYPRALEHTMCQGSSSSLPQTNTAQIWIVSGKWISVSEFSSHFYSCFLSESKLEKYKNLLARVVTYGTYSFYSYCSPEELDLHWHIRQYSLTDFGNGTLESFCAAWLTTNTYGDTKPVWQVAILHLGDMEQNNMETVIIFKCSHSLVDGYSFVQMVGALADNPAPYLVKDRVISTKQKLKYILSSPVKLGRFYADMAFSRNSQSPIKKQTRALLSPNSTDKLKWFMSLTTLNLSTVKKIRAVTNSHFACVLIAAQTGALRKLMLETVKDEKSLPENLWTGSTLPWPRHPDYLTNHWAMGVFKCPLRISNPLERLRWLEEYYREYTEEVETEVRWMYTVVPLLRMLPVWARRMFMYHDFALYNMTLFFGSLMLSSKKHYLLGREVKNIYFSLMCYDVINVALYGVSTSHGGQLDLCLSACNAIVKNQEELDRLTKVYFVEEIENMVQLCNSQENNTSGMIKIEI